MNVTEMRDGAGMVLNVEEVRIATSIWRYKKWQSHNNIVYSKIIYSFFLFFFLMCEALALDQ